LLNPQELVRLSLVAVYEEYGLRHREALRHQKRYAALRAAFTRKYGIGGLHGKPFKAVRVKYHLSV